MGKINLVKRYIFIISAVIYVLLGMSNNAVGWKSADTIWNYEAAKLVSSFDSYAKPHRLIEIAPPTGAPIGYPPLLLYMTYVVTLGGSVPYYNWLLYLFDITTIYLVLR